MKQPLPKTVDEAVDKLIQITSKSDLDYIKRLAEKDLILLHHSLWRWIRNNYGLWSGNPELQTDTKENHPDDASFVIIEAIWKKLRGNS